jgi:hypothetical protein
MCLLQVRTLLEDVVGVERVLSGDELNAWYSKQVYISNYTHLLKDKNMISMFSSC